jgi:hypothetical protein
VGAWLEEGSVVVDDYLWVNTWIDRGSHYWGYSHWGYVASRIAWSISRSIPRSISLRGITLRRITLRRRVALIACRRIVAHDGSNHNK